MRSTTGVGWRSGPRVELDISGNIEAGRAIRGVGDRAADMRPAMRVIRRLLIEGHRKQFLSKGGFLGSPWPALAPGTLARKVRMGQSSRPMEATGALKRALEGGRGKVTRVTRSSVTVGTSLFYAVFHMKGSKGKGRQRNTPARPPVGISDVQYEAALSIMERYLLKGIAL